MPIPIYQVDAFANRPFKGNPAAVCVLDQPRPDEWMQSVAAEMNLSETAFVRRGDDDGFELRWFTPTVEVELCGHATLASAHALWNEDHAEPTRPIRFVTKSGVLTCVRSGALIEMDFPAMPAREADAPPRLLEALDVQPTYIGRSAYHALVVVDGEEVLRAMTPDFRLLRQIEGMRGVIVTSASSDPGFDFVSRFFAPGSGVDEDPVTGSAHCCLAPYWGERYGRTRMTGFQASRRGGIVDVALDGDRVMIGGHAVTVMRGELIG